MNIIKSFNNTIDYLETVLDDEIDEKKVTQLSGYSYSMFSRLFSILTETTLSEYLRSRRLTEAAVILRNTDEKIIDVAFKFGYESSDSFGTAFKNLESIKKEGIKKMNRQYVHLSADVETAKNVATRHSGKYIILEIDTESMLKENCKFYLSENKVWLTDFVPSKFIKF